MQYSAGENVTFTCRLLDSNKQPFAATKIAVFEIFDPSNRRVIKQNALRDAQNPTRFTANFTLPATLPASNSGEFYEVVFTCESSSTTQTFTIISKESPNSIGSVILSGKGKFSDSITVNGNVDLTNCTCEIYTSQGELTALDSANITLTKKSLSGNRTQIVAKSSVDLPPTDNCIFTAFYSIEGEIVTKPLYLLPMTHMHLVNEIRLLVDRHGKRTQSYLDMSLVHLVTAIHVSIDTFNASPPQMSGATFQMHPVGMNNFILYGAIRYLCQSQYQAEGSSAFQFDGQGVQITVDRTQFLDNLTNQANTELDKLPMIKKSWLKSGALYAPPNTMLSSSNKPALITNRVTTGAYSNIPVETVDPRAYSYFAPRLNLRPNRRLL
jgi:hypothetical protein